jgi:hypothetical protein
MPAIANARWKARRLEWTGRIDTRGTGIFVIVVGIMVVVGA